MSFSFVHPPIPLKFVRPTGRTGRPTKRPRTPITSCSAVANERHALLPLKLQGVVDILSAQASGRSRYMRLIELGSSLEKYSPDDFGEERRVTGCVAVVYVHGWLEDNVIRLRGWADSKVVRGLVAMIVQGLDGCTLKETQGLRGEDIVKMAGLEGLFGGRRMLGLNDLLDLLREQLESRDNGTETIRQRIIDENAVKEAEEYATKSYSHGVWTARQGRDIAVLLSGGVDSSVAMRQVMEQGFRPHPFYLKIWLEDELAHLGQCPWEEDVAVAEAVCRQAGVKLETISMQQEYWDRVVKYTIDEARAGRTPNPDVMCNSRIKFGAFYDRFAHQFDGVVTGHYAQTRIGQSGLTELITSSDSNKDQTYFLAHLNQDQLSRAVFPIGAYTKAQVRAFAADYNLPNKTRKDSQGICFLGKLKFGEFLEHYLGRQVGNLVDYETGEKVGDHPGFWFFTVGQRKGIGLPGGPWYVVSKDIQENIVFVSRNYHLSESERTRFFFEGASWVAGHSPPECTTLDGALLTVKIRHGVRRHVCTVHVLPGKSTGRVLLKGHDKALAPGQFAVFYDNDVCLGSAIISQSIGNGHSSSTADAQREVCTQRL